MKYIIYTRASLIKKTNENPQSHDMQFNECTSIVGDNKFKHFKETNVSGDAKLDKRPVLMEAIESLEKGDVLLVWKSDRLFRSVEKMIQIKYLVEKRSATIQSATEANIFGNDSFSNMICTIMAAINQCNVEVIRSRVSKSMQAKIKKGEKLGHVPYGFRAEGNMLVSDSEEQSILDKMESMLSQGMTYRRIAESLNSQGLQNRSGGHNRKGGIWKHDAVHRLVRKRPIHQARMEALALPR